METDSLVSRCRLELIDLHDDSVFREVQEQRAICGWQSDTHTMESWKDRQKWLFWVIVRSPALHIQVRVGHISLEASSKLLDQAAESPSEAELSITLLFILPEHRSSGFGRCAMALAEEAAVTQTFGTPPCRFLTLTALSKRYIYESGPEWYGIWERLGKSLPAFSVQEWYEQLGYVSWKEEPLYEETTLDGQIIKLWEAFMKKDLLMHVRF